MSSRRLSRALSEHCGFADTENWPSAVSNPIWQLTCKTKLAGEQ